MSSNNDSTNLNGGTSNVTLAFVLGPVALGVVVYILIRYWSSVIRDRRAGLNGEVSDHAPVLGLSPSDIGSFPTFIYCGATQNVSGDTDVGDDQNGHTYSKGKSDRNIVSNSKSRGISVHCSICLCDLEDDDVVRMLPVCRHFFHIQCIDLWLHSHVSCPICCAELQIGTVALTEHTTSPPLPQFQYCDIQGSRKANVPATTEKLVPVSQTVEFTEIVVEHETKTATSVHNTSNRSLRNDMSEVQITIKDEIDIERSCPGEYLGEIMPEPEKQDAQMQLEESLEHTYELNYCY